MINSFFIFSYHNTPSIGKPGRKSRGSPLWLPYLRAIPSPHSPDAGTGGPGDWEMRRQNSPHPSVPASPCLGGPHVPAPPCPTVRKVSASLRPRVSLSGRPSHLRVPLSGKSPRPSIPASPCLGGPRTSVSHCPERGVRPHLYGEWV
jgi:hypothetical protein